MTVLTQPAGLGETDACIERQRLRGSGDSVSKTVVAEGEVALT